MSISIPEQVLLFPIIMLMKCVTVFFMHIRYSMRTGPGGWISQDVAWSRISPGPVLQRNMKNYMLDCSPFFWHRSKKLFRVGIEISVIG